MPSRKRAQGTVQRRLEDILSAIDEIRSFIDDMTFEEFSDDRRTYHAVVRCLEIISEASRHLPFTFKELLPDVAWRRIADAGNIYRHAYDAVSPRRIWDTATAHLSLLRPRIMDELGKLAR